MPIFDSGMEPKEITTQINQAVVQWCQKNKPELQTTLTADGNIQFPAEDKDQDYPRLVFALLGQLQLKKAKELGFIPDAPANPTT